MGARSDAGSSAGRILGSNVGSLLLPFSNLHEPRPGRDGALGLASYVSVALGRSWLQHWPSAYSSPLQRSGPWPDGPTPTATANRMSLVASRSPTDRNVAWLAGGVAMIGTLAAVAAGLAGGDMAVPFAVSSGIVAAVAVASGRLTISLDPS